MPGLAGEMELAELARMARSISAVKRRQAAEMIGSFVGQAGWGEVFEDLLFDGAGVVRKAAAGQLKKITVFGKEEIELLRKAAKSRDPVVRRLATECFGLESNLVANSGHILETLLSNLTDPATEVRLAAISSLSGIPYSEVALALSARLWDHDIRVRAAAAHALMEQGNNKAATKFFVECFASSPCGTFDIPDEFIGFDNLDNRILQIQVNTRIMAYILEQKDLNVLTEFVEILRKSITGSLDGSLLTTFANLAASTGKANEILALLGNSLTNSQLVNMKLSGMVEIPPLNASCREYLEKVIGELIKIQSSPIM